MLTRHVCCIYCQIFPFGSVPLKTYLPDGDIDLTAIEPPRSEEYLAKDVLNVLQAEEQNRNSPFEVKDVQYIHAEVALQFSIILTNCAPLEHEYVFTSLFHLLLFYVSFFRSLFGNCPHSLCSKSLYNCLSHLQTLIS